MSEATDVEPEEASIDEADDDEEEAPLVSLDAVDVHFNDSTTILPFSTPDTVYAVDDVDIEIEEEDVVVLVGESGSGKTTLGKTAIGLQRPTNGSVKYKGQDIWEAKDGRGRIEIEYKDIRENLQIIHQDPASALNPSMTILETLAEPLIKRFDDLGPGGRRERIYNVLEQVNLTPPGDYAARYPHQLSGGEMQRVILTRALLMEPDLVLADEAVSALDVSMRVETMDLMLDLQNEFGLSYLLISHNLSNARYFAEKSGGKIGIMYLGELVEFGTPDQIIDNPKHPYTKVLRWATPSLSLLEESKGAPPVRKIDIPEATNPPSGCRFHTRCPYARETCSEQHPELEATDDEQTVACFRQYEEHEYWEDDWLDADAANRALELEDESAD